MHLRGEPLFTHHRTPTRKPVGEASRLILPLANGSPKSTHFLVGIVTGEARPETVEDLPPG